MTVYHPVKIPGRPRRFLTLLGLVLLVVVLLGLSQTGFRYFAAGASIKILSPFWAAGNATKSFFAQLSGTFTTKLKLTDENTRLRAIIDQQATILLNQEILKQENLTLRQVVNRTADPLPLTVGRLVSRGQQFPFGQAIIDIGSQNVNRFLQPGIVVASGETVALGELAEIYETSAKMRFYSASGERLIARLGATHIPVELTGRGDGNFSVSLPRDLSVTANDQATVTVAGHEFVLALVSDIKRAAGDSFQEIFLRSPINITQLTWVEMYAP